MRRSVFLTGFLLAGLGSAAHADAIDGDWCNDGGKHFRIDGPSIELNSGTKISGDYTRHAFRYVGPAGDPEAGNEVLMNQQSEQLLHVRRKAGAELGPVEEWRRCSTVS